MMKLHFVGDGPRDEATIPHIVERVLQVPIHTEAIPWARLTAIRGSGYARRLRFAIRQAVDAAADGLVAVLDADKDPKRIQELRKGRDEDRQTSAPFPTAVGQAEPHGDAWLLDDPAAVRTILNLAADVEVISVRKSKNPKGDLNQLVRASSRGEDDILVVLTDIARVLEVFRCNHGKETGFSDFVEDVERELGPVAAAWKGRRPRSAT